jgi:hypothetical protein
MIFLSDVDQRTFFFVDILAGKYKQIYANLYTWRMIPRLGRHRSSSSPSQHGLSCQGVPEDVKFLCRFETR